VRQCAAAQARRGRLKTLECEPRRWKIIERVREKFSCRDCEAITEAPAPSHPIPRGFAGPSLLAMVLVNKFLLHQPLNRQSNTYAREGIEIDVSTLADRVGACVVALEPLIEAIRTHVNESCLPSIIPFLRERRRVVAVKLLPQA
jgi:transposase